MYVGLVRVPSLVVECVTLVLFGIEAWVIAFVMPVVSEVILVDTSVLVLSWSSVLPVCLVYLVFAMVVLVVFVVPLFLVRVPTKIFWVFSTVVLVLELFSTVVLVPELFSTMVLVLEFFSTVVLVLELLLLRDDRDLAVFSHIIGFVSPCGPGVGVGVADGVSV